MGISTFNPYVQVFVAWVKGRGTLVLVCLLLQLNFLPFPIILFISLLPAAFNCHHLPFLLEGVLSYNPPVRKSEFQPFDHFLIQPPLRCNIALY